jgi:hypothetical protein
MEPYLTNTTVDTSDLESIILKNNDFVSGLTAHANIFDDVMAKSAPFFNLTISAGISGVFSSNLDTAPLSAFTSQDQFRFDEILNNNFNIVSNSKLFERVKDYENVFKYSSDDFVKLWSRGDIKSTPAIHDWMNIYKDLYKANVKSSQSN